MAHERASERAREGIILNFARDFFRKYGYVENISPRVSFVAFPFAYAAAPV